MKIAYVILHFLAENETIDCIESILHIATKSSEHDVRIIVVDNNSPNDSYLHISELYKDNDNVVMIHNDENLGFAKGNNKGYAYAKKEFMADFIVMLNNDTIVCQNDFNEKIVEKYNEYHFGVLGPDIETADGFHQNPSKSVLWTEKKIKRFRVKKIIQFWMAHFNCFNSFLKINNNSFSEEIVKTDVVDVTLHGACLIFSPVFIEKFDGLCDKTFLYMEEDILKLQSNYFGFLMVYSPELRIIHKEDVATNMLCENDLQKKKRVYKNLIDSSKVYYNLMKQYKKNDSKTNRENI